MNYTYCPNCSIGLNSREMELRFCQNCKHSWDEEEEEIDNDFTKCIDCIHIACENHGKCIKPLIV